MLIVGCGYVGSALASRLLAEGHALWALRRRWDTVPAGLRPIAADLSDPSSLRDLPAEIDVVVYAAAADRRDQAAYRKAYIDGLRNLIAALPAGSPRRRFFFTSSTSVYAQNSGEWVDEDSPAEAQHFSGRCMLEAERLLWTGGLPVTVLRLGGIYGPGRTRLVEKVRRGEAGGGQGVRYTNRIHRDDCAAILEHLMQKVEHPDRLYLGVDEVPAPMHEVHAWLASQLGVSAPVPPTSGDPSNKRCRNQRLLRSGYRFIYPSFREGYAAMLKQAGQG